MAKEYIEREAALETLDWYEHEFPECKAMILAFRKDISAPLLPAADVRPVVRGRWSISEPGGEWACSKCGTEPYYASDVHTLNFCPNCGADMREVK